MDNLKLYGTNKYRNKRKLVTNCTYFDEANETILKYGDEIKTILVSKMEINALMKSHILQNFSCLVLLRS